jgi:hypothetical protein
LPHRCKVPAPPVGFARARLARRHLRPNVQAERGGRARARIPEDAMPIEDDRNRPTPARSARDHAEALLDEALSQTFPASDPIAVRFDGPPSRTPGRRHSAGAGRTGRPARAARRG